MGLEEHLLTMFREDFEFHDAAGPSHHGGKAQPLPESAPVPHGTAAEGGSMPPPAAALPVLDNIVWLSCAERELKKIPFFVRGKARRNTEKFAVEKGLCEISVDTLYEAKAHYAR